MRTSAFLFICVYVPAPMPVFYSLALVREKKWNGRFLNGIWFLIVFIMIPWYRLLYNFFSVFLSLNMNDFNFCSYQMNLIKSHRNLYPPGTQSMNSHSIGIYKRIRGEKERKKEWARDYKSQCVYILCKWSKIVHLNWNYIFQQLCFLDEFLWSLNW